MILSSINQKTEPVSPEEFKKIGGFLITKILSYRKDLILVCNELNKYPTITPQAAYDFYIGIVPKNRKYAAKQVWDVNPNLDIVKEYYKCNTQVANEYLRLLSESDIDIIKLRCYKGGKNAI